VMILPPKLNAVGLLAVSPAVPTDDDHRSALLSQTHHRLWMYLLVSLQVLQIEWRYSSVMIQPPKLNAVGLLAVSPAVPPDDNCRSALLSQKPHRLWTYLLVSLQVLRFEWRYSSVTIPPPKLNAVGLLAVSPAGPADDKRRSALLSLTPHILWTYLLVSLQVLQIEWRYSSVMIQPPNLHTVARLRKLENKLIIMDEGKHTKLNRQRTTMKVRSDYNKAGSSNKRMRLYLSTAHAANKQAAHRPDVS